MKPQFHNLAPQVDSQQVCKCRICKNRDYQNRLDQVHVQGKTKSNIMKKKTSNSTPNMNANESHGSHGEGCINAAPEAFPLKPGGTLM